MLNLKKKGQLFYSWVPFSSNKYVGLFGIILVFNLYLLQYAHRYEHKLPFPYLKK